MRWCVIFGLLVVAGCSGQQGQIDQRISTAEMNARLADERARAADDHAKAADARAAALETRTTSLEAQVATLTAANTPKALPPPPPIPTATMQPPVPIAKKPAPALRDDDDFLPARSPKRALTRDLSEVF